MDGSVTLVVPTLGTRPTWLFDCLASVTAQAYKKCHVIVVAPSNAEIDDVCRVFDIDVARLDRPGMAHAVNYGWSVASTSEYITWLGDDDLLAPGSLELTVAFLSSRPECSMVYGRVRYIDADGASLWMSRPTRFAAPYMRAGKNFLSQQGSLIRRSSAEQVNYLDSSLMNAMDQDIFTRLGCVGRRGYIPRELGAFRWHPGSITATKGRRDESEFVRRRHLAAWQRQLYIPWRRIGNRLDWAVDAAVRRFPVPEPPCFPDEAPYTAPRSRIGVPR